METSENPTSTKHSAERGESIAPMAEAGIPGMAIDFFVGREVVTRYYGRVTQDQPVRYAGRISARPPRHSPKHRRQ